VRRPGIQYYTTNHDCTPTHETPARTSPASKACFPLIQRVVTDRGLVRIGDLVGRAARGESFAVLYP